MVGAALANDTTLVAALYDFDYRIDVDFLEGKKCNQVSDYDTKYQYWENSYDCLVRFN